MKAFVAKLAMLLGIAFLLLLGLSRVDGLVSERMAYRDQALAEVSTGLSGDQKLAGPMLRLPFVESWKEDRTNDKGQVIGQDERSARHAIWLLPDALDIKARINPDFRQRGIFRVAGYESVITMKGHFTLPTTLPAASHAKNGVITLEDDARATLGLDDPRGIRALKMRINGTSLNFEPGTPVKGQSGAQARLALHAFNGGRVDFELELALSGANSLTVIPLGKETTTTFTSPWPHPSFFGSFLPAQREVTKDGFTAHWQVSNLANDTRDNWLDDLNNPRTEASARAARTSINAYGVRLIEPVNAYSLTDRAIKYGLLFIGMTLAVFALFELLKQLQVHPVQYLMIGLALLLFFVLLLSLSEQIGFARAYGCASAACVLLIGYYSRYVLRGWQPAGLVTAQLALSFGGLYGLLHSDQNALMIGAVILFALLAAIMVGTRNVNWFEKFSTLAQRSPRM